MSSVEQPTNWVAVIALVCGVVGVVGAVTAASLGALFGSVAVVLGFMARRYDGRRGMAVAGIVLGVLAVVLGVVSTILSANGAWPI